MSSKEHRMDNQSGRVTFGWFILWLIFFSFMVYTTYSSTIRLLK